MPKYYVSLSATAYVTGSVEVEASTEEEAEKLALKEAENGDVLWRYNGVSDNPDIRAEDIR